MAVVVVMAAGYGIYRSYGILTTKQISAEFVTTDGLYVGDQVKVLGVVVGAVTDIAPAGDRMHVTLRVERGVRIPAEAKAVILAQSLVSSRAIQLAPAYSGGPELKANSTIPLSRTAVPVEWDDFRNQLQNVTNSLGPTEGDSRGPVGRFVNSAAEFLSGKGDKIHDAISQLSSASSTLSDGRKDLFATVRNLQVFTSAIAANDSAAADFNRQLATVTDLLTNSDDELADAFTSLNDVSEKFRTFLQDNRTQVSGAVADLAGLTSSLNSVRDSIEQTLHVAPTAFANFYNIYQPAQGAITGVLALTQFANPIQFICGAVQASGQLGAAEAAEVCASKLAPILKMITFNYPPIGINPIAGVQALPDQIDYSQNSLRPTASASPRAGAKPTSRTQPKSGNLGLLGPLLKSLPGIGTDQGRGSR